MTTTLFSQLTVIAAAGVAAPILAELSGRLAVPGVVLELLLGIVVGPQVLNWVSPTGLVLDFSNFGLALLMFLAGAELDLPLLRGTPIKLAGLSWGLSLCLAGLVALYIILSGAKHGEIVTGLCLSTTALGTLLPILRDADVLHTKFGRHMLAIGSIGEFGPIVLVALIFSGQNPGITGLLLLAFAAMAVVSALAASRPWGRRITETIRRGLHASSQLPIRLSMLLIMAMVFLATHLGLDLLLGSFAAGMIVRVAVAGRGENEQVEIFRGKLEAVGFGFFIPIFFIVSGMALDLSAFGRRPVALLMIPVYLLGMLIVRGGPILFVYRREFPRPQRAALALMGATGLPLIVVIATIGRADGHITSQTAAALITAGMMSVLLLPTLALRVLRGSQTASTAPVGSTGEGVSL